MPYPGFEPGTSGTAAGFPNHCTIWSASSNVDKWLVSPEHFRPYGPMHSPNGLQGKTKTRYRRVAEDKG